MEKKINSDCDQIYRSRYPTTPPDSRTSYYSTEDDPSHSEEVDYDGVNDHLPNSGYYDSSYNNLTREPDEYDCDNYEPNHSTSEVEEECYKPDDTNTYDNYEDDDEGEEEEDGEGYVCPTCGTHSQPDERDKFRGEDLHGRSDEYIRYINEMCEGSEFHVDAYIKRRNYAMCGDDLDVDKDNENAPVIFKCAALFKRATPCFFTRNNKEEIFEHLQNDHFTSNYGLIHTYARVYTC